MWELYLQSLIYNHLINHTSNNKVLGNFNWNFKFKLIFFFCSAFRPSSPESEESTGTRMSTLSNLHYGSTDGIEQQEPQPDIERQDPQSDGSEFERQDLNVPSKKLK